jgi:hypothetical protein
LCVCFRIVFVSNEKEKTVREQKMWLHLGVFLALLIGAFGLAAWRGAPKMKPATPLNAVLPEPRENAQAVSDDWLKPRLAVWQTKVFPRLEDMGKEQDKTVQDRLQAVTTFFAEADKGAEAFAESILSLKGKWLFCKSKVTDAAKREYAVFLQAEFAKHVLNADELKSVLEACVNGYASDEAGREGELLVKLRADLEDSELGRLGLLPAVRTPERFQEAYQQMLAIASGAVGSDLKVTLGREVVTFVAADVAAQILVRVGTAVATRLGVSAGVLSTGAVSGAATLGAGLLAGIALDQLVGWAMKQAGYDPAQAMAQKVKEQLAQIKDLILEGEAGSSKGLKAELKAFAQTRGQLRQDALRKLVFLGGAS